MLKAAFKQLPWMLALFVLGPIAGALTGRLRAPDGSGDATFLISTTPLLGILAAIVTIIFAGICGVFAARVVGCRSGLNAAGIVVAWAASQTTTVDMLLRRTQSAAPLTVLAIEGLLFGLLAVPVAAIIWQAGLGRGLHGPAHPLPQGSPGILQWLTGGPGAGGGRGLGRESDSLAAALVRALTRPAGLGAVAATVAVGVAVAWFVAQDTLKGQAIFAAAMAGILAVPVGRLAGEALGEQPPMASFFVGFALLAAAGPLAASVLHGSSIIPDDYAGRLIGVAAPVSLDWLAGAFIGIPIGEAWFVSMFRSHAPAGAAGGVAR